MLTLLIAAAIALPTSPSALEAQDAAQSQDQSSPSETEAESPKSAPVVSDEQANKKVCRTWAVTGSRFKKKFCKTEREWELIDSGMKDVAHEMRRSGAQRVEGDPNQPGAPTANPQ